MTVRQRQHRNSSHSVRCDYNPNTLELSREPPYLGSTRKSGRYKHEMLTDDQHAELAAALHTARAAVVVSSYASPLYERLYDGWDRVDVPTTTGQGGARQDRIEVLWSNRPIGDPQLFSVQ